MHIISKLKYSLLSFVVIFLVFFRVWPRTGPIPKILILLGLMYFIFKLKFYRVLLSEFRNVNITATQNTHNSAILNSKNEIAEKMAADFMKLNILERQAIQKTSGIDAEIKELYFDLDGKYEFLRNFKEKSMEIIKQKCVEHIPYTPFSCDIEGLADSIWHHCDMAADNLTHFYFSNETDLIERTVEYEIFQKHGIDLNKKITGYRKLRSEMSSKLEDLLSSFVSDWRGIEKGVNGEIRLREELDLFKDILTCLYNIRMEPQKGDAIETDVITISTQGIFSIEAKNYGEEGTFSIEITADGQWLKVYPNGKAVPMENIFSQGNRHIGIAQRYLNGELQNKFGNDIPYIYIEPIYVMANDVVRIDNKSSMPILRSSQVFNYIRSKQNNLNKDYIPVIKEIFEKASIPAGKYPMRNYCKELETFLDQYLPWIVYYTRLGYKHVMYMEHLLQKGLITEDFEQKAYHAVTIPLSNYGYDTMLSGEKYDVKKDPNAVEIFKYLADEG